MIGSISVQNRLGKVYLAPFDVVLSPTDVVQPDLLFISESRRSIVTEKNVQGAPDWVVEILSPESARRDLGLKKKLYANHGVREYWVADPSSRTIQVFTLGEQGYELVETAAEGGAASCRLLPGLIAEHASVFRSE
ncbi:MAG: Uma2 family endonuclease [bacterium]|nr:Uma2 family endonuclease [bacterium]